jgi:hypothetical protein
MYIGRKARSGRRKPRYDLTSWNRYVRIESELPRTNDSIEGWHRGIKSSLDGDHPSIWKFITFLINEEAFQKAIVGNVSSGENPQGE